MTTVYTSIRLSPDVVTLQILFPPAGPPICAMDAHSNTILAHPVVRGCSSDADLSRSSHVEGPQVLTAQRDDGFQWHCAEYPFPYQIDLRPGLETASALVSLHCNDVRFTPSISLACYGGLAHSSLQTVSFQALRQALLVGTRHCSALQSLSTVKSRSMSLRSNLCPIDETRSCLVNAPSRTSFGAITAR